MERKQPHSERLEDGVGKPGRGASAVGYVRYSSDLQNPTTITTQKRRIQEYAEANGWHIVHWYEETETSAKFDEIEKRPVFAQLLEDAGREFQVVLCYMNDRWARNVGVAYTSLDELRSRRVWWATADGLWDIDKVEEDGPDIAFASIPSSTLPLSAGCPGEQSMPKRIEHGTGITTAVFPLGTYRRNIPKRRKALPLPGSRRACRCASIP